MRYHERRITLDDRERLAFDVLHKPQESTEMTQSEARILLTTRFASLLHCIAAGQKPDVLEGLSPKALERLNEAMDRADQYDELRGMTAILPTK